MFLVDMYLL